MMFNKRWWSPPTPEMDNHSAHEYQIANCMWMVAGIFLYLPDIRIFFLLFLFCVRISSDSFIHLFAFYSNILNWSMNCWDGERKNNKNLRPSLMMIIKKINIQMIRMKESHKIDKSQLVNKWKKTDQNHNHTHNLFKYQRVFNTTILT